MPQKIDIEDKIMGPLSMVQFVYAVLGTGAGYIMLNSIGGVAGWVLAIPIFIFTFCIVFVKINGRPFGSFLKNFIAYTANPKTRLWHKSETNVRVEIYQPRVETVADPYANKHYSRADIEKLANIIDKRGKVGPPTN